ncbi:MAG: signal transduction histidine kinase/DNA-binding NarL/FixJ family response regulator [Candidatus Azotimanducaceae bacterium]|jgi:signal transduction histidine kinase/DNA-binding NarL/FixJ family response regulator
MVTVDQSMDSGDMEERLRETESAIRTLEAATSAGRWAIDLTLGSLVGSEQLAQIYGFERFETLSMDAWLGRVHPEDQESFRQALRQSGGLLGQQTHSHRLVLASGEVKHLRQIWLVHHRGNIPRFIKGVCLDETALASQPTPLLSDQKYLGQLPLPAISINQKGFIEYFNVAAAELDVETEVVGGDLLIGGQTVWRKRALRQQGQQESIETTNRMGEKLLLDIWSVNLEHTSVVFLSQSGWVDDAEDDYYRDILNNLPLGVLICDGAGHLLFVNDWMLKQQSGVDDGLYSWPILFDSETGSQISPQDLPVSTVFATGKSEQIDRLDIAFNDKTRRTVRCDVKPFRVSEMATGTGRVQIVFELLEPEALDTKSGNGLSIAKERASTDLAKKQFLSNMSHELRTPLNAMLGFQQLISQSGELSRTQKQNLKLASQSGLKLLRVINDLIEISRVESTETDVKVSEFALSDLIREVQQLYTARCRQKGLTFRTSVSPDLPERINTDREKLFEIVNSLLDNAFKFTEHGEVILDLDRAAGTNLRVIISDTGPGIREDLKSTMFEPFQDLGYLQERGFGAGLGLPISKRYTEKLGGAINLRESNAAGTTFVIDLPVLIEPSKLLPMVTERTDTRSRVLVVDDNFPGREVLKQILSAEGLLLDEAGNGLEAVEKARAFQPHLILMDLEMPIMDGFEATRRIKNEMPVKILAISASIFDDDVQRAFESGVDGFIEKPYRLEDVMSRVKSMLAETQIGDAFELTADLVGRAMRALPEETRVSLVQHLESANLGAFRTQLHRSGADGNVRLMIEKMLSNYQYDELARLLTGDEPSLIFKALQG